MTDAERSRLALIERERARGRRESVITRLVKKTERARLARERARLEREDRLARERARLAREDRLARERAHLARERARLTREEADRDRLEYELNFWKTDEFKKWLIEHNRLLKHYISEGSLYRAIDLTTNPREFDDIDIWEYLLDEEYILDYSDNNFNRLYYIYRRGWFPGYDKSDEKKLLFTHMYLKEAFFGRHAFRNIDFRRKLCLLADSSRLHALYFTHDDDKEEYIRTPIFYKEVDSDKDEDDYSIFDTPQNPELLRKELNIATGHDKLLQEVMEMILLARQRNYSSPLITTEFASSLLTLNSKQLEMIHEKLQKILLE